MDTGPLLVTLDVEGVLLPEIWIAVAERTGIEELRRTTRDEPDYDVLMRYRLDLLERHGLGLSAITKVIGELSPLPGAAEFLDELRARYPVVLLSDTFAEFAGPLMAQLGLADDPVPQPRRRRTTASSATGCGWPTRSATPSWPSSRSATACSPAATPTTTSRCCSPPTPASCSERPIGCKAEFPQLPAFETYDELRTALR